MNNNYEFSYQSPKQKIILLLARGIVLLFLIDSLYSLGWQNDLTWHEKLVDVAGVFMAFWAYSTLLQVKVEIQELFVPPANFSHAKEFLFAALILYISDTIRVCYNILNLHGIYLF